MPSVCIDSDEWYPVYSFSDPNKWTKPHELYKASDEQVARWKAVFEQFDAVQKELIAISDAVYERNKAARSQ